MFKLNKGSTLVILIVSIVVAVLVLGTVAGIIIWKVFGEDEYSYDRKKRDRDDNGDDNGNGNGDNGDNGNGGGLLIETDCGISTAFLSDFSEFSEIDFEKDNAMVCMGRNIENNCKSSRAVVKINDGELGYKISGTSKSNCRARVEYFDPYKKETVYVECPLTGLTSIIRSDYQEIAGNLSGPPGGYAAAFFIMVVVLPDDSPQTAFNIGCTTNLSIEEMFE